MEPGYTDRDILLFSRISKVDYEKIVIINSRTLEKGVIKRVIGMPGDEIEIRDGITYRNGAAVEEPYIVFDCTDNMPRVTVPQGAYFVMGDNRVNSTDSRNSSLGFVPGEDIIGVAIKQ